MKKITDYSELSTKIMSCLKNKAITNFYLSKDEILSEISAEHIYIEENDSSLIILRKRETHYSMYYYLWGEFPDFSFLPAMAVAETAMREKDTALKEADELLVSAGFCREFMRNRMSRPADISNNQVSPRIRTAEKSDFDGAKQLLYNNFSSLTGCLPSDDSLMTAIGEKRILLHDSGGLLHFEKTKTAYELRHLCTNENARGKGIGGELVAAYHSMIDKKSVVWVRDGYAPAEKIYINNGYTRDGMYSSVLIYK